MVLILVDWESQLTERFDAGTTHLNIAFLEIPSLKISIPGILILKIQILRISNSPMLVPRYSGFCESTLRVWCSANRDFEIRDSGAKALENNFG